MLHTAHPKLWRRHAIRRRRGVPLARTHVRARPLGSNAAPLTLAAVVVLDLVLAASVAVITAVGG